MFVPRLATQTPDGLKREALDKYAKESFWLIGAALVLLVGFIFVSRSYLKKKGLYGKA